jgi:hypothetical protein
MEKPYHTRLLSREYNPCPLIWTQSSTYGTLLNQRNVQCQNMVELTNAIPTREASSPSSWKQFKKTNETNFFQSFWMNVWRSLITHDYSAESITTMFTPKLSHSQFMPWTRRWSLSCGNTCITRENTYKQYRYIYLCDAVNFLANKPAHLLMPL